jgi:hypothetical protein
LVLPGGLGATTQLTAEFHDFDQVVGFANPSLLFCNSISPAITQTVSGIAGRLVGRLFYVAGQFSQSGEYYSNFVKQAYQVYLARAFDPLGLQGWVIQMEQGLTDEKLEAAFISSGEYINRHGGFQNNLPTAVWIRAMYLDLLNRTPTDTEANNWLNALHHGEAPADIAFGFSASPEREGIRVQADYRKYLGRSASQTEVAGWVEAFENHTYTTEGVVAGFVGSAEYFQRHGDNIPDWLTADYGDVLGRMPDMAGYDSWLQYLQT